MRWLVLSAIAGVILALLLFAAGCSRKPAPASVEKKGSSTQLLHVSFYDERHAGRLTASGEVFDPNALTSAHRSYPFGTVLKVINPKNGKSVLVRVNDRGPYVGDRVLDLSQRAAREIGIEQDGVGGVQIEVIKLGTAGKGK